MGKGMKAVPPVDLYIQLAPVARQLLYTYRCELIFILYATGIPEPSDEECQEGSHSVYLLENRKAIIIINMLL